MHTHTVYSKGFTLVETLVAIAVLLLVIIGPMTIAQKGIQNARYAREQMTAIFLAQEAVEGVRQIRDEYGLRAYDGEIDDTSAWISEVRNACSEGEGCAFVLDATNPLQSFRPCNSVNNCQLYIDSETGDYTHNAVGNDPTLYTRRVTVGSPDGNNVPVTVEVSWYGQVFKSPRSVILETWIYDHYERYEDNT